MHLVEETGQALSRIVEHGTDVRKLVFGISSAAGEQSTGIGDVSQAVQSVERITQQNAAIVEEHTEICGLRQRVEKAASAGICDRWPWQPDIRERLEFDDLHVADELREARYTDRVIGTLVATSTAIVIVNQAWTTAFSAAAQLWRDASWIATAPSKAPRMSCSSDPLKTETFNRFHLPQPIKLECFSDEAVILKITKFV